MELWGNLLPLQSALLRLGTKYSCITVSLSEYDRNAGKVGRMTSIKYIAFP